VGTENIKAKKVIGRKKKMKKKGYSVIKDTEQKSQSTV
jgi:hypothetical protein